MFENTDTTVIIFVVAAFILTAVEKVVSMMRAGKRTPPIEKELQDYLKRAEYDRDQVQVNSVHAELWRVINGERVTMRKTVEDINRSLGRIEGKIENLKP